MKIQKAYLLLLIVLLSLVQIHAQEVVNVTSRQEGNNIKVHYEITDARFYHEFDVLLYISFDGGETYQGPMEGVSGDVGAGVTKGKHTIVWNPFEDVNSLESDVVFDVRAWILEDKIKKKFFVSYNAGAMVPQLNYLTPVGLQFGQIGKTGWYVTARLNTSFNLQSDFVYNNEQAEIQDYDREIMYYAFDDEVQQPRLSVTGGVIYQLSWKLHVYAGAGYGQKSLLWHINEYSYENDEQTGDAYVKNDQYSTAGIEAEGGFMIQFNPVILNIGVSALNGKYFSGVVGLGMGF